MPATTMTYGAYSFSPAPMMNLKKEYVKTPDGTTMGAVWHCTLEGTLLPADLTDSGLDVIKELQDDLEGAFNQEGCEFALSCGAAGLISVHPRIINIDFPTANRDNWTMSSDYIIEMEWDEATSGVNHYLSDASESWDVEWLDSQSYYEWVGEVGSSIAKLTHEVSATGKRQYTGCDTVEKEGWEHAKDWVLDRIGASPSDDDDVTEPVGADILGLWAFGANGTSLYNHSRHENLNEEAGEFSVSETWECLSTGTIGASTEDYTVEATREVISNETEVTVNGTIVGLEDITYPTSSGTRTINTSRWDNAQTSWGIVENLLFTRASGSVAGGSLCTTLHETPSSKSVTYNPPQGQVQYTYVYNDRDEEKIKETWNVEWLDNPSYYEWAAVGEVGSILASLTHEISAVGEPEYSGCEIVKEAWEVAKDWVLDGLGASPDILDSYGFGGEGSSLYNHMRSESIDELEGTFSLTDSWRCMLTGTIGNATEDFTIEYRRPVTSDVTTINIQGTIIGLEDKTYPNGTGTVEVTADKWSNAQSAWNIIEGLLPDRVENISNCSLNSTPANISVSHSPSQGQIQYSYEYNDRDEQKVQETWNVEWRDTPSYYELTGEAGAMLAALTHEVSAVGEPEYSGCEIVKEAWEVAKDWVLDNLGGSPDILDSYGFGGEGASLYNHMRSESIDELAGTFSLTDNWQCMLTGTIGAATEDFTIEYRRPITSDITTVSIQGTIIGFEGRTYPTSTGTVEVTSDKWSNAQSAWNIIEGLLPNRVENISNCSLNSTPSNISISHSPSQGQIQYSYEYNDRDEQRIQEVWNAEWLDSHSYYSWNGETGVILARLTHQISAEGEPERSGCTVTKEAWEVARDWVLDNLGSSPDILDTWDFGGSDLSLYNHMRSESIDELAGRFSVSDNWLASTASATEDFTMRISKSKDSDITSISIDGTIIGLEGRTYPDGTGAITVSTNKWDNAKSAWAAIEGNLYGRLNTIASGDLSRTLHTEPLNTSISHSPSKGQIQYSYVYNDRPCNYVSGSLSESLTINTYNPTDVFTKIIIPGRAYGPILQDLSTPTESRREVTMEVVMPPSSGCYDDNCTNITNTLAASPESTVGCILNCFETQLNNGYYQVFKHRDEESWNPLNGRYSRSVGWTYSNCSGDAPDTSLTC